MGAAEYRWRQVYGSFGPAASQPPIAPLANSFGTFARVPFRCAPKRQRNGTPIEPWSNRDEFSGSGPRHRGMRTPVGAPQSFASNFIWYPSTRKMVQPFWARTKPDLPVVKLGVATLALYPENMGSAHFPTDTGAGAKERLARDVRANADAPKSLPPGATDGAGHRAALGGKNQSICLEIVGCR
jgi:hypothetical protein